MLLFYTYEDDRDMKFTDKYWFRFRYKIDPNSPNAEKCRDMMMYYIVRDLGTRMQQAA